MVLDESFLGLLATIVLLQLLSIIIRKTATQIIYVNSGEHVQFYFSKLFKRANYSLPLEQSLLGSYI